LLQEVDVVLPSPWWPPLTYKFERLLPEGLRVSIPLRQTKRIGFSWQGEFPGKSRFPSSRLREIIAVIDEKPPLPADIWKLLGWLGNRLPFGIGHAIKISCPAALLRGQAVEFPQAEAHLRRNPAPSFCYLPREISRYEVYIESIAKMEGGGLIIFPDREALQDFFNFLPDREKSFSCIWPVGGGERLWETWLSVRRGEKRLVLGTSGAVFAPIQDLSLVVVEEEADPGHQMPAFPRLSARTVASKRAAFSGASLLLGGSLPSARVAMLSKLVCPEAPRGRVSFIRPSPGMTPSPDTLPFLQEIPISEKLIDESRRVLCGGRQVLWVLDRKGYAGELRCTDCGRSVVCRKCGGRPRWSLEKATGHCLTCGEDTGWPEECPSCRSRLLQIWHPGLEKSYERARSLFGGEASIILLPEYATLRKKARCALLGQLKTKPALLLGTRSLLSLCRKSDVGLIGWLDADTENWKQDYSAKAEGFRIVWSSCWIGKNPDNRQVILQSRKPKRGWQVALEAGFNYFWDRELAERRKLELPPFCFLLEVTAKGKIQSMLKEAFEREGLEVLSGTQGEDSLQIKVHDLEKIQRLLAPFFAVNSTSLELPHLSLDFE
jgi:primosomal protein N' (replication factor Y)